jgi:serine protease AprX
MSSIRPKSPSISEFRPARAFTSKKSLQTTDARCHFAWCGNCGSASHPAEIAPVISKPFAACSRTLTLHIILGTLAVLLGSGSVAAAAGGNHTGKVDPAVRRVVANPTEQATVRVIIKARGAATDALNSLLRKHGAVIAEHGAILSVSAEVHRDALAALAVANEVVHISLDASVRAATIPYLAAPAADSADHLLQTLGIRSSSRAGRGVGVAVIDSGIQAGPGLTPHASFDFTRGSVRPGGLDGYGHGTHVAGLIAAGVSRTAGMQGIAPGVRLISLKVLDSNGEALTSTVIRALEFAVANRKRLGIDVINLSLGHPSSEPAASDPLVQAVEAASRAGLIVIVAAGNRGISASGGLAYAGIMSPANAPSALTVGSLDTKQTVSRVDDAVAAYSSRGPTSFDRFAKPDVVAPGHRLVSVAATGSALYKQYPAQHVNDAQGRARYLRLSGTSMAAAVASGAVARLIEAHRAVSHSELTPNQVKAMLQFTSLALAGDDRLAQGAGAINVAGALSLTQGGLTDPSANTNAISAPAPYTTIGASTYVWNQTIVWGNTIIWGNSLPADEFAWSPDVVWGSTIVWGNAVLVPQDGNVVEDLSMVWEPDALPMTPAGKLQEATGPAADTIVWGNAEDTIVWGNTVQP